MHNKTYPILAQLRRIPGGLMLIPMLIAAAINTVFPSFFLIGDPATALFTSKGTMSIVGLMLFLTGTQMELGQVSSTLKRGGLLTVLKIAISAVFSVLVIRFWGLDGIGGISTLAMICCISSANPGVYIALMEDCGDDVDKATFALVNLIGLPMLPMVLLSYLGGAGFDIASVLATVIPFMLGFVLGNLDPEIKALTKSGISIMLPFLGICLGSGLNIVTSLGQWHYGLLLLVLYMVVNAVPMFLFDRVILQQRGHCSLAICCVAGLSLAVPAMAADLNSAYLPYVQAATAQLAFVVLLSGVLTSFLVKLLIQQDARKQAYQQSLSQMLPHQQKEGNWQR